MVRYNTFIVVLFFGMFFVSCSDKKNKVLLFNLELANTDAIIDSDTIELQQDRLFTTLKLEPGVHHIRLGGILPDSINLKSDGIVSSPKTDFIIFPMLFGEITEMESLLRAPSALIVGDSMIIYERAIATNQEELLKHMRRHMQMFSAIASSRDSTKKGRRVLPLMTLQKSSQGFINKIWDYPIGKIPEKIATYGSAQQRSFIEKKVVVDRNSFLMLAKTSEYFIYEELSNLDLVTTLEKLSRY